MNNQSFNNVPSAFGEGLSLPNKSRDGGLPSPVFRIRLKFSRLDQARNLSHLEQIRELRRMVKASGLPYAVARCGKTEIPKMSFGPAISVGYESLAEYADLYLLRSESLREAFDKLAAVSERGILVTNVKRVPVHFPSIEALVNVAEYEISGETMRKCDHETIKRFLERSEIIIPKNKPGGRSYFIDARPLIISMELKDPSTASSAFGEGLPVPSKSKDAVLHLTLRFGPKRNIKPERIVELLMKGHTQPGNENMPGQGMSPCPHSPAAFRIMRKELYWENSAGRLVTP